MDSMNQGLEQVKPENQPIIVSTEAKRRISWQKFTFALLGLGLVFAGFGLLMLKSIDAAKAGVLSGAYSTMCASVVGVVVAYIAGNVSEHLKKLGDLKAKLTGVFGASSKPAGKL